MFDREPMPLRRRIGHNCVFYAVPDACDFFNGQPLDENLIPQFRKEQERRMSLFKTFSGSTGVAGGFEISLQMILSHLGKFKIKPIKLFLGDENIAQAISSFNYVKKANIPVEILDKTRRNPFPAMVFVERPGEEENHVWFCGNKEAWEIGKHLNIGKGNGVVLYMSVDKVDKKQFSI